MVRRFALIILLAPSLVACAGKAPRPPPLETYRLGMHRADLRDYRQGGDICSSEPRWLVEELRAPTSLLGRYLDFASPKENEAWTDERARLVREGTETITRLADVLKADLALLRSCSIASNPIIASMIRDASARVRDVEAVLPTVPALAAWHEARIERERWIAGRSSRHNEALRFGCEDRSARGGVWIYDAVVDCEGNREWNFCDGAQVRVEANGERSWRPPVVVAQTRGRGRRRAPKPPKEETYQAAVKAYDARPDQCPPLPPRP